MKIIAILVHLLGLALIFASLWVLVFSAMIFDAPGSEKSQLLWAFLYGIWAFPLLLLIGEVMGWRYFAQGNYKASIFAYKWALLDIVLLLCLSLFL